MVFKFASGATDVFLTHPCRSLHPAAVQFEVGCRPTHFPNESTGHAKKMRGNLGEKLHGNQEIAVKRAVGVWVHRTVDSRLK